ncbi:hypothetical protein JTP77_038490, partial [Streptomyces sp. S9]|nr:hypothetical protein [Streptomyces sp. S9]
RARIALAALSDCAQSEDETSLRRWLLHALPRRRLQALRGLIRGNGPELADALAQALCDTDPQVAGEAFNAYRNGSARLTLPTLERAWTLAPQYRARWIFASELLDKWQTLDFLLGALSQSQPEPLEADIVARLQSLCNRRRFLFDSATSSSPPLLLERLKQAAPRLPGGLRHELSTLITR